jgi:hypothetical protein
MVIGNEPAENGFSRALFMQHTATPIEPVLQLRVWLARGSRAGFAFASMPWTP